jgi:iron complex transport system permease protein
MKHTPFFLTVLLLLMAAAAGSLFLGRYPVGLSDMVRFASSILHGQSPSADPGISTLRTVFLCIRLPRILGAVLVGSALTVSGTTFQSMFLNPLVSPGILGVLSGASFGAAFAMLFFKSMLAVQISAFGFGCFAVVLSMLMARFSTGDRILMLDRKSTRLNSSHRLTSRMPSSA